MLVRAHLALIGQRGQVDTRGQEPRLVLLDMAQLGVPDLAAVGLLQLIRCALLQFRHELSTIDSQQDSRTTAEVPRATRSQNASRLHCDKRSWTHACAPVQPSP